MVRRGELMSPLPLEELHQCLEGRIAAQIGQGPTDQRVEPLGQTTEATQSPITSIPQVHKMTHHGRQAGGRRIRPALCNRMLDVVQEAEISGQSGNGRHAIHDTAHESDGGCRGNAIDQGQGLVNRSVIRGRHDECSSHGRVTQQVGHPRGLGGQQAAGCQSTHRHRGSEMAHHMSSGRTVHHHQVVGPLADEPQQLADGQHLTDTRSCPAHEIEATADGTQAGHHRDWGERGQVVTNGSLGVHLHHIDTGCHRDGFVALRRRAKSRRYITACVQVADQYPSAVASGQPTDRRCDHGLSYATFSRHRQKAK